MAGYWPLHSPTDNAQTIAGFDQTDELLWMRLGLSVLTFASVIMLFFTSAVSIQIPDKDRRICRHTHFLQIAGRVRYRNADLLPAAVVADCCFQA